MIFRDGLDFKVKKLEHTVTSREWGRGWELGSDVHTAVFKWITNKDLPYSTEDAAQCHVAARGDGGGGGGEERTHVSVWLSPLLFA